MGAVTSSNPSSKRLARGASPRVLVRLPSWLGDAVAAEPLVRRLAELHRAGALGGLSLAGPAHVLPALAALGPARRLAHQGRGGERAEDWREHDVALLLTGSFRSAWTAWRAGIPERIGALRDGRGPWLTASVSVPRGPWWLGAQPVPEPYSASLERIWAAASDRLGVDAGAVLGAPRLEASAESSASVASRLGALGLAEAGVPRVWINAGGRSGSAKAPPLEHWLELIAGLSEVRPLRFGLLYGPGEESRVGSLARALGDRGIDAPLLWPEAAADLEQLIALCAHADLTLTSDTGPRHVARAAGSPTFTLFGPSDPRHTDPDAPGELRWLTSAGCAPCGRENCRWSGAQALRCFSGESVQAQVGALVPLLPEL